MIILSINLRKSEDTIKWSMRDIFQKNERRTSVNAPILKDDNTAPIVAVGSMVFINGVNIERDSVVMLDNKIMNKASYTIAENAGIYLKAPHEGVFNLRVTNKHGASNQITFKVSDKVNIHVMNSKDLLHNYNSLAAWVGSIRIPLNAAGQGIAVPGTLRKGVIIVQGLSKTSGKIEIVSIASLNEHQKIEGVVVSSYSTARYMLDQRLSNLGLRLTSDHPSDQQALIVGRIDSYIKNMQQNPESYSLQSSALDKELTQAVREIRKLRE